MGNLKNLFSPEDLRDAHPDTLAILQHFDWEFIPVEKALYHKTWVSKEKLPNGTPAGTAILALYCEHPYSASCFHRLKYDEVWHFYDGDPMRLFLLHPDGSSEMVIMGNNILAGQQPQLVIPAGTWQAGEIVPGGRYSVFGCTMAPGFIGSIFEGAKTEELVAQYPEQESVIRRLNQNDDVTRMPTGYLQSR